MCDKINADCSIRINRSWTFEISKSAAAMAAMATMVPTPLYICVYNKIIYIYIYIYTLEPLNNRHFGTSNFWHNFTVIDRLSSLRGKIVLP